MGRPSSINSATWRSRLTLPLPVSFDPTKGRGSALGA